MCHVHVYEYGVLRVGPRRVVGLHAPWNQASARGDQPLAPAPKFDAFLTGDFILFNATKQAAARTPGRPRTLVMLLGFNDESTPANARVFALSANARSGARPHDTTAHSGAHSCVCKPYPALLVQHLYWTLTSEVRPVPCGDQTLDAQGVCCGA